MEIKSKLHLNNLNNLKNNQNISQMKLTLINLK
jgi:hypothetical protein